MARGSKRFKLTREQLNKLKVHIENMAQEEAAAESGIRPRSFRRYKKRGAELVDKLEDEVIDYSDLTKEEKLLVEFFEIVDIGVAKHQQKYSGIMRDTALGQDYVMDASGKKQKTNWVAAKEYYHMLTFATAAARQAREDGDEFSDSKDTGLVETPAAFEDESMLEALAEKQQKRTQSLANNTRREQGQ